jgi:hypothetical protein
MTYIHSFQQVAPPARFDGIAWTTAHVGQSLLKDGPFTEIAVLTIPTDPTPAVPDRISLTVTTATIAAGFFRFFFADTVGNISPYTAAIQSPNVDASAGYTPSVDDVAVLMRSRLKGEYVELDTFTDETRPTAAMVQSLIDQSVSIVSATFGSGLASRFNQSALALATLRTALLLEPSYFPEQARPDKSAWTQWKALYDEGMVSLIAAVERDAQDGALGDGGIGEDEVGHNLPAYGFPANRPDVVDEAIYGVRPGGAGFVQTGYYYYPKSSRVAP